MDNDKLLKLMDKIQKSRREVEGKPSSSLTELKQEMNSMQERMSQDLPQRITKPSYQFQQKSNEHQFSFNSGIQESIAAARSELSKLKPSDEQGKAAITKVESVLDEGTKALATRQNTSNWQTAWSSGGPLSGITKQTHWRPTQTMKIH